MGAALWTGGSVALGVFAAALHRAEREGARLRPLMRRVARSMALVMWPALAVTIATGAANLAVVVPDQGGWVSGPVTPWLAAKLVTVAVVVGAAGLHTFLVGPRVRALEDAARAESAATLARLRRLNLGLGLVSTFASVLAIFLGAILSGF